MNRVMLFFAFMGAFAGAFALGSTSGIAEEDAEMLVAELEKIIDGIDAQGIFMHNTAIALPMFIPGLGAAWGLFSAWSTGAAFAALASLNPGIAEINPLSILFLSPFGLMEVTAYSIGTSRSLILAVALARRTGLRRHAAPTLAEIGIVVALLLAGGYVEFHVISAAA